jgi:hypothetical protein
VRNQNQQPIVGAVLQFTAGNGQRFSFATDTGGRYCARNLAPGSYIVSVSKLMLAMNKPANGAPLTVTVTNAPTPVTFDIAMHLASQMVESLHGPTIGGDSHPPPVMLPPVPSQGVPPPAVPPAQPPVQLPAEHPAEAKDVKPEDIGAAEAQWFDQLKTGAIRYTVPTQMTIGDPSSVSVTIFGYQAAVPASADPNQQPAPLKVSNFMRVTLSQDDNPDEFTVVHGDNADEQFVPVNSSATWKWTVTPKHLGKNLKLQLQAFVLYSDPKQGIQQSFPAASREVTVVAEGVKGIVHDARDSFWSDPSIWIKYMLPGGAGFAALAAIVAWWIKRKKNDSGKSGAQS